MKLPHKYRAENALPENPAPGQMAQVVVSGEAFNALFTGDRWVALPALHELNAKEASVFDAAAILFTRDNDIVYEELTLTEEMVQEVMESLPPYTFVTATLPGKKKRLFVMGMTETWSASYSGAKINKRKATFA